ncbi:MAG: hypothetical protein ACI4V5_02130 [Prevotella sp.]
METTDITITQIERFIRKIAQKFPCVEEPSVMTDIHLVVSPDSGELMAFDDNDDEITRCVVDEWINCLDDNFYDTAASLLRRQLTRLADVADNLGILKPYSYVLETDEHEHISELYATDSDMQVIGGDLMEGLEDDLNKFLNSLFEE